MLGLAFSKLPSAMAIETVRTASMMAELSGLVLINFLLPRMKIQVDITIALSTVSSCAKPSASAQLHQWDQEGKPEGHVGLDSNSD